MDYQFCARTDPGRVRGNNEDAVAFDAAVGLCVLADGLGGHNAGEVASQMATATVCEHLAEWLRAPGRPTGSAVLGQAMQACVLQVHRDIQRQAKVNPRQAGMSSTLVVGVFEGEQLVLGHIGDSRCYRWREGVLTQITKDHSRVQEQVDAGLLTPEQAATAAHRNLITRALGAGSQVELELHEHLVRPHDIYLMCSDGLSDMVSETEMKRILSTAQPLEQRAQALVDAANARGGRDNVTVLLAWAKSAAEGQA